MTETLEKIKLFMTMQLTKEYAEEFNAIDVEVSENIKTGDLMVKGILTALGKNQEIITIDYPKNWFWHLLFDLGFKKIKKTTITINTVDIYPKLEIEGFEPTRYLYPKYKHDL